MRRWRRGFFSPSTPKKIIRLFFLSLFHYALFTPPLFTEVTDVCFHKVTIITFTVHHARLKHSSHGRKLSHLNFSLVGPHGVTIGRGSRYVMRASSREVTARSLSPLTQTESKYLINILCLIAESPQFTNKNSFFLILTLAATRNKIYNFLFCSTKHREGGKILYFHIISLPSSFSQISIQRAHSALLLRRWPHTLTAQKKRNTFHSRPISDARWWWWWSSVYLGERSNTLVHRTFSSLVKNTEEQQHERKIFFIFYDQEFFLSRKYYNIPSIFLRIFLTLPFFSILLTH